VFSLAELRVEAWAVLIGVCEGALCQAWAHTPLPWQDSPASSPHHVSPEGTEPSRRASGFVQGCGAWWVHSFPIPAAFSRHGPAYHFGWFIWRGRWDFITKCGYSLS